MATCPECDFDDIDTEDYDEGDTLSCPECGTSLVVMGGDELEPAAVGVDVHPIEADADQHDLPVLLGYLEVLQAHRGRDR